MRKILQVGIALIVCMEYGHSQILVNEGATISITENTDFSMGDSVINRGTITNNGTIYLSGSWLNEATYNSGSGNIVVNSSQPQTINHNNQYFNSLTITGGGDKFFEEDIHINSSVFLDNGRLISLNEPEACKSIRRSHGKLQ